MTIFWLVFVMTYYQLQASVTVETVPKEAYQTYNNYVQQQAATPAIVGYDDWIPIQYSAPLIAKFQVTPVTTVSISKFSGNIGSKLANLNRWRGQLGLAPVDSDEDIRDASFSVGKGFRLSLENNGQYVLIIWLTEASNHFFIKVESSAPINHNDYTGFVNKQAWSSL